MGGGRMDKNSYNSRSSSSSSMFNGDVRVLECWCHIILVVRKANTVNTTGRLFYVCPLPKVCLTMVMWYLNGLFKLYWFWIFFVYDDGENCQFFVWVEEAEELGYFKNNGVGHGRNARLMESLRIVAEKRFGGQGWWIKLIV